MKPLSEYIAESWENRFARAVAEKFLKHFGLPAKIETIGFSDEISAEETGDTEACTYHVDLGLTNHSYSSLIIYDDDFVTVELDSEMYLVLDRGKCKFVRWRETGEKSMHTYGASINDWLKVSKSEFLKGCREFEKTYPE